jgi:hypothetical protein
MQYSTAMGECGLKVWAKGVSQMALKQGIDKFTYSTSSCVGERMLLETIANRLEMQNDKEQQKPMVQPCISKRRLPHFCYQREEDTVNSLKSLNQKGHERNPDTGTGVIQKQILEAIYDVEKDNNQMFFDIWCEARLPIGQYIQCWPQYRQSEGSRYDWVMMKFESEEKNGEEAIIYPGKVLALYEDNEGTLKVLVHSVEHKTATNVEGPFGDSRLVTHYRLEFNQSNRKPRMYSVK